VSQWSWHVEPVGYKELCAQCYKPLRQHAGDSIVRWRDRRLYAVGCLLDRIVETPLGAASMSPDAGCPYPWGAAP